MTQPLNELPDFEPKEPAIQCSLCLHEIVIPEASATSKKQHWVQCPRCEYHQPLSKLPRVRDLAIFGGSIAVVYFTTIVAILLTR